MRDPLARVPIRYKLPLSFLTICLVAFGVGGGVLSTQARDALEAEIGRRVDDRAAAMHVVVERHLDLHRRRAEDFASDGFIRATLTGLVDAIGRGGDEGAKSAREALVRHLRVNKLPLVDAFVGAVVFDAGGVPRAWYPPEMSVAPEVPSGSLTRVGPLLTGSPTSAGPSFRVSTPLVHQENNVRIGWLQLVVDARLWAQGMDELATFTPLGHDYVRLISAPDGVLELGGSRDGAGDATPERAFSYQRGVAGTPWHVAVDVDRDAALEPAVRLRDQYLLIGAVLLLVTSGVLFFPLRFLLRPLSSIAEAARRIARGDFHARVDHESGDEIGDLARGFNAMAEAVEERTGELERTASSLRRREEEVRLEHDRLVAVIRSMEDGLFILDASGRVLLANQAAEPILDALGTTGDAVRRLECRRDPNGAEDCLACLAPCEEGQQACVVERSGRIFEVLTKALPAASDEPPRRLCVGRDVTSRIASQESQAHQERMTVLGEVAAVMAHELNNPLAAISMFSQMLQQQIGEDSALREPTDVIRRNVQHCKQTITSLLDLAARANFETADFELCDVVQEVARVLRPIYHRAGVDVAFERCGGDCQLRGDEVQIRQVFINLLMNAVQAAGCGGRVDVRVAASDDTVAVTVRDDGPGIAPEVRGRIFEPFFTTKGAGVGTGLGLPTSRRIVGEHGGELSVLDTGPGGTTFAVRLPRKAERVDWRARARRNAPVTRVPGNEGE